MKKKKFYSEGLFFSCTGCGNCCKIPEGWVEMDEKELNAASELLKLDRNDFIKAYSEKKVGSVYYIKTSADQSCIFLDINNRCTLYEARPQHCRTFPFWPENLKSMSRWERVKDSCEGIGEGDFFSLAKIKDILGSQRKKNRHKSGNLFAF